MTKIWMSVLCFLLMACGCGGTTQGLDTRFISSDGNVERLNHSVVALVTVTRDEATEMGFDHPSLVPGDLNTQSREHSPYCSGFFINEEVVFTAAHCVSRSELVETFLGLRRIPVNESPVGDIKKIVSYSQYLATDGRMTVYRSYQVVRYDAEQDLAILVLASGEIPHLYQEILEFGSNPRSGEQVYVIGHPAGQPWTLTQGIISRPFRKMKRTLFGEEIEHRITQTSAQTYFGNSGGPLIDNEGRVIGVASAIIEPHLAFFTHIQEMRKFTSR